MNLADIKGLNPDERVMIEDLFQYPIEADYHPSVSGCWFQAYNFHTQDVMVIDKSTTVEQLLQVKGL